MKGRAGKTIWRDYDAMCIAAAYFFVECCQRAIADHGRFLVAFSGGNTPRGLYSLLPLPAFNQNIDWNKVFIFWSDERFVPHDDPESNYRMAKETLLDQISIPEKNIFPIPVNNTLDQAAKDYEKTILKKLGESASFDLLLLGVGNDGHTASLFPGNKVLKDRKRLVREVIEEGTGDKAQGTSQEAQVSRTRITFTFKLINNSSQVMILSSGKEKAEIIARIFNDKKTKPLLPSQMINPRNGTVLWLLDEEAAANI